MDVAAGAELLLRTGHCQRSINATSEAAAITVISSGSVTGYDGTPIMLEFYTPGLLPTEVHRQRLSVHQLVGRRQLTSATSEQAQNPAANTNDSAGSR